MTNPREKCRTRKNNCENLLHHVCQIEFNEKFNNNRHQNKHNLKNFVLVVSIKIFMIWIWKFQIM